jgi:hypothetical protein
VHLLVSDQFYTPTNFLTDLAASRNFELSLGLVPGDVIYESNNMPVPRFILRAINYKNTGAVTSCSFGN